MGSKRAAEELDVAGLDTFTLEPLMVNDLCIDKVVQLKADRRRGNAKSQRRPEIPVSWLRPLWRAIQRKAAFVVFAMLA